MQLTSQGASTQAFLPQSLVTHWHAPDAHSAFAVQLSFASSLGKHFAVSA